MLERAIKELCGLSDDDLFKAISEGIRIIVDHVKILESASFALSENGHTHSAWILGNQAAEEAAKILILLDAVRCPPEKTSYKSRTLGYFYDHLAKSIYSTVHGWYETDFEDLSGAIELLRRSHWLGGPNGDDWIFPNRLIQVREDDLYVGYLRCRNEANGEIEYYWSAPGRNHAQPYFTSGSTRVAYIIHEAGLTTESGLKTVAELWRPLDFFSNFTQARDLRKANQNTLDLLNERGLLIEIDKYLYAFFIEHWNFPLWPLDLKKIASLDELRAVKAANFPE